MKKITYIEALERLGKGEEVYLYDGYDSWAKVEIEEDKVGYMQMGRFIPLMEFSQMYTREETERLMNRWEALIWAQTQLSKGWLVKAPNGDWQLPGTFDYALPMEKYRKVQYTVDGPQLTTETMLSIVV